MPQIDLGDVFEKPEDFEKPEKTRKPRVNRGRSYVNAKLFAGFTGVAVASAVGGAVIMDQAHTDNPKSSINAEQAAIDEARQRVSAEGLLSGKGAAVSDALEKIAAEIKQHNDRDEQVPASKIAVADQLVRMYVQEGQPIAIDKNPYSLETSFGRWFSATGYVSGEPGYFKAAESIKVYELGFELKNRDLIDFGTETITASAVSGQSGAYDKARDIWREKLKDGEKQASLKLAQILSGAYVHSRSGPSGDHLERMVNYSQQAIADNVQGSRHWYASMLTDFATHFDLGDGVAIAADNAWIDYGKNPDQPGIQDPAEWAALSRARLHYALGSVESAEKILTPHFRIDDFSHVELMSSIKLSGAVKPGPDEKNKIDFAVVDEVKQMVNSVDGVLNTELLIRIDAFTKQSGNILPWREFQEDLPSFRPEEHVAQDGFRPAAFQSPSTGFTWMTLQPAAKSTSVGVTI